jgi:DNA polymerase-3 subunit delta'
MTALLGHDEAWREWRAAAASGNMHHAWLLAGPKGVGKAAFARAAARELVAEPGTAQPEEGSHPDVILLEPLPDGEEETKKRDDGKPYRRKRSISVDQIRRMQQRLVTRPTLGARRAIIIDPADDLEKSAVNALLKSLEEPPAGTFFLLVAHRPGRLLATVRSRCRVLRFAPLDGADMAAVLAREAPEADAATRDAAIAAAEGSPGTALAFVGHNLGKLHALMRQILAEPDAGLALRTALADEIGTRPDRERLLAALELARATLAQALAAAPREQQLRIVEAHGQLVRLAGEALTFNFDTGLLMLEIGGLLASAAMPREAAH